MRRLFPLLLLLTACPVAEFSHPPGPPQIARFEAAPFEVRPGGAVTLRWRVIGAEEVEITGSPQTLTGLPGEGERTVTVTASTSFELIATGEGGRATARASVVVRADREVEILRFEVTPTLVEPGDPVRAVWRTNNAERVVLRLSTGETILDRAPDAGTIVFRPEENVTVLLRAEGWPEAKSALRTVRVRPDGPVITRFYAEPPVVVPGQPVGLVWEVAAADRLRLFERTATSTGVLLFEQEPAIPVGYLGLQPEQGTHTYRLEVSNPFGTILEETTLVVDRETPPEILSFTVTPTITGPGGDVVARWSTRHAPRVSLWLSNQEILPNAAPSGFVPIVGAPAGVNVFELVAARLAPGEAARQNRTVVVSGELPEIRYFLIEPRVTVANEPITIIWGVSDATEVRITTDYGEEIKTSTTAQSGTFEWTPDSDVALALTARNDRGVTSAVRSVQAAPLPEIVHFGANATEARLNRLVTFDWETHDADGVTLTFSTSQQLPPVGSARQEAGGSAGIPQIAWLSAYNALFIETTTVSIQILPPANGPVEEEPNDDLPVAAGPYFAAAVDGMLIGGDLDLYEIIPSLGERILLDTAPLFGCTQGVAAELYEYDPVLGLLGPRLVLDTPSGCASANAMTHPAIASLEPPVYVRVRSPAGSAPDVPRSYRLSFQTEPDVCGDGVIDLLEHCDDGNTIGGDGCASTCRLEQLDEVESNDVLTTPTLITAGLPVRGFLAYQDVDIYRFELMPADAGQKVLLLEAPDAGACDLDMELVLMDAVGRPLARDDNDGLGCPQLAGPETILAPGVYHVGVYRGRGLTLPRKGRYVFRIQ